MGTNSQKKGVGLQSLQLFELNQPFWVWPQSTLDVPPIMSICSRVHYHQADMVLGDVMIQNHGLRRPSLGQEQKSHCPDMEPA